MKILELRFKNLNSLYGEWIIDFTRSEYTTNGIFALTGPTGAGKSTILDAICLALYGVTPRLKKVNKGQNEIMSRQTGECYAEVLFESQAGRFRCHWEQRTARKKAGAKLQEHEHQIINADTGKPIETKKLEIKNVVKEKTGMDFDRFTRSILLAQGGFDTFLRANIEQKSKILEQITGTEIYSEISCRVHLRQKDEQKKLALLNAETSGIEILDSEQENDLQQLLEKKKRDEIDITKKLTTINNAILWLSSIKKLKEELSHLAGEEIKLKKERDTFKPEQAKLEQALKAASLDGIYATLTAIREQQRKELHSLATEETALPECEQAAKLQANALKAAEQQLDKDKEKLKLAAPLIQQIRLLDQTIVQQAKTIEEERKICGEETRKIKKEEQNLLKEQKKRTTVQQTLTAIEQYLTKHSHDEWLVRGLTGLEEQFRTLRNKQQEIQQKENTLKSTEKELAEAVKKLETATQQQSIRERELTEASHNLRRAKESLQTLLKGKLLREYRSEKDMLLRQMVFIKRIEELEEYRCKLEKGKQCPLCGSTEHPFVKEHIPVSDATEREIEALEKLITQAEKQESCIQKQEQEENAARIRYTESEKSKITAANDKKIIEQTSAELKNQRSVLYTNFRQLEQELIKTLSPFGIKAVSTSELLALPEKLTARLQLWQEQTNKKIEAEKQLTTIDSEINRLNAIITTQYKTLTAREENIQLGKKRVLKQREERKQLYGNNSPDTEEKQLNKAITTAETKTEKARTLHTRLQQKVITATARIHSLKKGIKQREPELEGKEIEFSTALAALNLADEKMFLSIRLPEREKESLSARAKALEHTQTELNARKKDRESRLATENARQITQNTLEELEPQQREYTDLLKELRESIAALKHKLHQNCVAKEKIKEKQAVIEAQKRECLRWEKLHSLIGSADGNKYRKFAQGLTFELMITYANRQLEKMTDRYLLIRDKEQPLELNVIDNYQAGEIRSSRNLSGGESFIISLTLALGLSKMASQKVRVDSLFLDEGFGTLDENALESALEALSCLQQEGKLIGIISHIPALKERISTQINVIPLSNGHSRLSGPGCTKKEEKR